MKGYVRNCYMESRKEDDSPAEDLFSMDGEVITPYLDGYAIIPMSRYEQLIAIEVKADDI